MKMGGQTVSELLVPSSFSSFSSFLLIFVFFFSFFFDLHKPSQASHRSFGTLGTYHSGRSTPRLFALWGACRLQQPMALISPAMGELVATIEDRRVGGVKKGVGLSDTGTCNATEKVNKVLSQVVHKILDRRNQMPWVR